MDLFFDIVKKRHTGAAWREIALNLVIPFLTITVGEPVQERRLLFAGQSLDCLLDLRKVHT